jgi:hypothetical protein
MDPRERYDDPEENLRLVLDAARSSMWSSLPGVVVSFSPGAMTVSVQPTISQVNTRDGEQVNLPVLQDVPVVFPGGGGATLTFPISAGDECLLVFASRAIDSWWQSGGVQPPAAGRSHSLSDAFALVGVRSRPRALGGVSTGSVQLRADSGASLIELTPAGGIVRIVAPGGLMIVANVTVVGDVTADGISLKTHRHSGVQPGASNTGGPVP